MPTSDTDRAADVDGRDISSVPARMAEDDRRPPRLLTVPMDSRRGQAVGVMDPTESALAVRQRVVGPRQPVLGNDGNAAPPRKSAVAARVARGTGHARKTIRRARTRIAQSALVPIEDAGAIRAVSGAARAAGARFLFSVCGRLLSAAWLPLHPLLAGLCTAFILGLLVVGFIRRR